MGRQLDISSMKYAYKGGHNYAGPKATYYCDDCGLDLHGEQVCFVAAGDRYADGEWSKCPRCGVINLVEWDDEHF
jgi:hypothetical protein